MDSEAKSRIIFENFHVLEATIEEYANQPYIVNLYIQKNEKILTHLNKIIKFKINTNNKETEIVAYILEISEDFTNDNENIMKIIAVHPFFLTQYSNKFKVFSSPTYKSIYDVFDAILKDYKLVVKQKCVGCFEEKRDFFIQYDESDMNYIYRKSHKIGANIQTCFDGTIHISSLHTLKTDKKTLKDLSPNKRINLYNKLAISTEVLSYNPEKVTVIQSAAGTGSKFQQFRNDILENTNSKTLADLKKDQFGYNGIKFITNVKISPFDEITTETDKLIVHKTKHIFSYIKDLEYIQGYHCEVEAYNSVPEIYNYKIPLTTPQRAWVTTPNKEEALVKKDGKIFIELLFDKEVKIPVDYMLPHHHNESYSYITPRETEEVIVEFLNNNPDFPMVIGSINNGKHKYQYKEFQTGFSYATQKAKDRVTSIHIDATEKKKESVKTNIPHDFSSDIGKNVTINLLTEDDKGDFAYTQGTGNYTHKQKKGNFDLEIDEGNYSLLYKKGNQCTTLDKGNQTITLHEGNRSLTLDKGNQSTTLSKGNQTITLHDGNRSITLDKGDITIENKKGNYTIHIKDGQMTIEVSKDISIESKSGDIKMKATNIKMEAKTNIDLKCTNFNTKFSAAGKLEGPTLSVESSSIAIKGASMQVEAAASLQMKSASCAMQFMSFNITSPGALNITATAISCKAAAALSIMAGGAVSITAAATSVMGALTVLGPFHAPAGLCPLSK